MTVVPSRRRGRAAGLALACSVSLLPVAAQAADASVADGLRALLEQPDPVRVDGRELLARPLRRFYRTRDFAPVWGPDPAGMARGALLLETLAAAGDQGLDPAHYQVGAIHPPLPAATPRRVAERELLLTDALLRYATDIRSGRVRATAVEADWGISPPPRSEPGAQLAAALEGGALAAWLAALPPPHEGYLRLGEVLRRYRTIADRGGWPAIPDGPPIVRGRADTRASLLRQRLAVEGDLAGAAAGDAELERAVRRFQRRHGLEANGIVGTETLQTLNVPVALRIRQVALNLERWRWLPRALEDRHLVVNAADATLALVEEGRVVLSSRVVVGDPEHPTPVVQSRLTAVLFNPPWSVPTSIAVEEFLPRLRVHPRFLADNDMVVLERLDHDPFGLTVDWRAVPAGQFPFRLQQRPGPGNPLGRMKFVSPNRFDVFLHDTPLTSLFERSDRALSHGCVRVERARELLAHVLAGQPAGSDDAIARTMASGKTRAVAVARPLPVYLLYWTAFAEDDGTAHFRDDIYGRDDRLTAALSPRARPRTAPPRPGAVGRPR